MASAQGSESDIDEARALFGEGIAFIDQERYQEAVEIFERALALHQAPTIVYNLGIALARSERLIDATEHLQQVSEDPDANEEHRLGAQQLLSEILARIGSVTIRVEGDSEGLEVTLDGSGVDAAQLGSPIDVDPGAHRISLRRGETELAFQSVEVLDGASSEVFLSAPVPDIPSPQETAELAATDPETPEPITDGASGDITSEAWFWTVIGVAVLAIAAGIIAGVVVSGDDGGQPIQGNLDPPFLDVLP